MQTIALSQGQFAKVDDEDYPVLSLSNWYAVKDTNGAYYAKRNVSIDGKMTTERMHNVILGIKQVDHKDGDGLNNQKSNLRPATYRQNARNTRKRALNRFGRAPTSQYKGVSKKGTKWKAQLQSGRVIFLGHFDTEVTAALAYDAAALEHFGEYARLNFPV